ncbi:Methionyl-tRNA formyltransferase [Sandaracinus amylolyticus]|uniref:Methionyl-tRNA formyltransferase n=2 Tax=Sandaracinus amylolyticus TaxID=927083 RepID=A0A0F6W0P7_9BACT|nr:Methionyl-tRNA formyltransferase [Sandaracinus amylolyticus]
MMTRPRALFFGTPQFAVPCLDALCDVADVVRVISQPDRPAGRGLAEQAPPVKQRAIERGIPVMQPTKVKPPELAAELKALDVEVALVVAYGRILPKGLLEAPRRGCVNVHASLLPRWRGAAPIQWAVAEGDAESGVCLMEMDEGLDTGPVFARAATPIGADETAGELGPRLSAMGAELVRAALPRWLAGELRAEAQDPSGVTLARLLTKEDGFVDLGWSAQQVHDRARGMHPWPGASAMLVEPGRAPVRVKLHRTRVLEREGVHGAPGAIVAAGGNGIEIACGTGRLALLELQLEGRKKLGAAEFLAGRRLAEGTRLIREGSEP